MTPAQRDALARSLSESLRQIDDILRRHKASPRHLPAPSRRAYEFLKQVDLRNVQLAHPTDHADANPVAQPESVSFRGLRAFLDRLLDDVALTLDAGKFNADATLRVIGQTAQRLDHTMQRDGFRAEHLKSESRGLVGWFRYFADEHAFDRYARAVQRAQSVFAGPIDDSG